MIPELLLYFWPSATSDLSSKQRPYALKLILKMEVIRKIGYPANILAKIISKLLQDGEIWSLFWESCILWPPFLPGSRWEPYPCVLSVTGALTAHQSSVCLQQVAAITESNKWLDTEISSRGLAGSKPAAQSLYLSMEDERVGEWEQHLLLNGVFYTWQGSCAQEIATMWLSK